MADLTDEVVTAAVAGDSDALGTVYAVLSPKVHGYLRARGADDPDGLTHEVFVHVLRRMGGIVGGAAGLRTFVFSVAHARYVDEVRRHERRPAEATYRPELDDRFEPSAETTALNRHDIGHLADSLARLQDDQRTVITLRVLGDLSIEQTAEVLGRSPGAVKQLQRRGLLALRALVDRGELAL